MRRRRFETREFPYEASLFWTWIVVIAWAPVPLGSNRPWAWGMLEALVFALAACWLVLFAFGKVSLTEPLRRARWFLVLLGMWSNERR